MKHDTIATELVWIWIGTKHHKVDLIAPLLGLKFGRKYKVRSLFCDQQSIKETKDFCLTLRKDKSRKFKFVAVDVGFHHSDAWLLSMQGGVRPASAVKEKQKIFLGDVAYIINIKDIYSHVDGEPLELFLANYSDKEVIRKRNKLLKKAYLKLDNLFAQTHEVRESNGKKLL